MHQEWSRERDKRQGALSAIYFLGVVQAAKTSVFLGVWELGFLWGW